MKIGFFVPCYIDAIHPQAAISTYGLLKKFGLDVEFIEGAACCGLPELDMGYLKHACLYATTDRQNFIPTTAGKPSPPCRRHGE